MTSATLRKYISYHDATKCMAILANNMEIRTHQNAKEKTIIEVDIEDAMRTMRRLAVDAVNPKNFDKYFKYQELLKTMIKDGIE